MFLRFDFDARATVFSFDGGAEGDGFFLLISSISSSLSCKESEKCHGESG
jgi:hypothetical protein